MSKKIKYIVFFICLSFCACNKDTAFDCVKTTGEISTEDRYFSGFKKIIMEDNINLILVQNLPDKIIIEAGKNLLPKISVKQDGTTLTIENKNSCNWVRNYDAPIKVYVGANYVKEVIQNGYGKLETVEEVETDTLRFQALTFGDVDLHLKSSYVGFIADEKVTVKLVGTTNKIDGFVFKNAQVDLSGFVSPFTQIQQNSILDVKAYSNSILQSKINGKGNLVCYGNPSLIEFIQVVGKGTLKLVP